ncbi:MAG: DUF5112 domain-containing protein [Bacteroides sp.]|nr:DUF5112 domain-containing protein [Roseburia sp.]MCM1346629.1 DUF5112 domain-containing protein [Bacteroides sp.]MCM1421183.1 DUF5112 domain-containing protein [Bacteroides sp.]
MRIILNLIYIFLTVSALCVCAACDNSRTTEMHAHVDSLNMAAYNSRYRSLDSTELYARRAFAKTSRYADGKNESFCHLAFVRFMRMDYAGSKELFAAVLNQSDNELLKLIADVGMMKICQRISANKEFYDYHQSAQKRISRISKEDTYMSERQKRLWNYAQSEFHLVSSTYYYYLRQERQAAEEIAKITVRFSIIENDSAQLASYFYMTGSGGIIKTSETDNIRDEEERMLVRALALSRHSGLRLFEGLAMQALADNLIHTDSLNRGRLMFIRGMLEADSVDIPDMPRFMAEQSLKIMDSYGCMFYTAAAYITISEMELSDHHYTAALEAVAKALEYVNVHHSTYCSKPHHIQQAEKRTNASIQPDDRVYPYSQDYDSISTEMRWIADGTVITVPEWMASIREHLSKVYSAMGMKRESDYNRNIYLDILDATRQDMKMQQRYETLAIEEKKTNAMLIIVGTFIVILICVMRGINIRLKQRSKYQAEKLSDVTKLCRKLTMSIPTDAIDKEDMANSIHKAIDDDVRRIFPEAGKEWEKEDGKLKLYDLELLNIVRVFFRWAVKNGETFVWLGDKGRCIEEEHSMHEMNIAGNKRANIDKRTCLSIVYGITPFLDRAVNEISKLAKCDNSAVAEKRLLYVSELIDKINEYNEVLTHWIKVRQGTVSLHIENFSLDRLFSTLGKGRSAFENKQISLKIEPTTAVVKADKALTLFMMNTLLDNARKYTPAGGCVCLRATEQPEYVEIDITDTGCGLSDKDIALICGEKVYDSAQIGNTEENPELKKNKGYGFGLMNCKGIIEKYRKTGKFFSVCNFGIESTPGKGSRFFFRLPKGIIRGACIVAAVALHGLCTTSCETSRSENESQDIYEWTSDDPILHKASNYADSAYYANVEGMYSAALLYIDSARMALNEYYLQEVPEGTELMVMEGNTQMPEIDLWNKGFNTDYHVILDIRNEAAIAALALNRWNLYTYNNEIYTRLYKLMAQDNNLESYCNTIRQSNINKQTFLIIFIFVFIAGLLVYYLIYYRHNLLPIFNMRQLMQFNGHLFASKEGTETEVLLHGVSDIRLADGIGLCLIHEKGRQTHCTFSASCPDRDIVKEIMNICVKEARPIVKGEGRFRAYPLTQETEEGSDTFGAIVMVMHSVYLSENEELIFRLIAQFTAIHLYYSSIKINTGQQNIEQLEDERNRAEMEANNIHVQNMVLDNCLSTIKHETMYYPNKIKQIADSMRETDSDRETFATHLQNMSELICYYKETFTLLSSCALRQLDKVVFRRKTINVADLASYAEHGVAKLNRKYRTQILIHTGNADGLSVTGDIQMLEYLIDNLLSFSFEDKTDGALSLTFKRSNGFVVFTYSDSRLVANSDNPQRIFYADNIQYDAMSDKLRYAQYLICKQIIREHDDFVGQRGCRIYAEKNPDKGCLSIVFTIPERKRIRID